MNALIIITLVVLAIIYIVRGIKSVQCPKCFGKEILISRNGDMYQCLECNHKWRMENHEY